MRIAAVALFISAAIGSASAHAANPYEVFRPGMSEAAFEKAVVESDGEVFDPIRRAAEEYGETPEVTIDLRMFIDGMASGHELYSGAVEGPLCGSLRSDFFHGIKKEREAFEKETGESVARKQPL